MVLGHFPHSHRCVYWENSVDVKRKSLPSSSIFPNPLVPENDRKDVKLSKGNHFAGYNIFLNYGISLMFKAAPVTTTTKIVIVVSFRDPVVQAPGK